MFRFKVLKFFSISLTLILSACGNMKPNVIEVASYPEVDQLLTNQISLLDGNDLNKEVWLDGKTESKQLQMDSAGWNDELSFLKEINPNQTEYVGAFEESETGNSLVLKLQEGEKGSLTYFSRTSDDALLSITATIHEDKDVYIHHKEVEVNLVNGKIIDYQIIGYQKILLKDTIRFRIKGSIVN